MPNFDVTQRTTMPERVSLALLETGLLGIGHGPLPGRTRLAPCPKPGLAHAPARATKCPRR